MQRKTQHTLRILSYKSKLLYIFVGFNALTAVPMKDTVRNFIDALPGNGAIHTHNRTTRLCNPFLGNGSVNTSIRVVQCYATRWHLQQYRLRFQWSLCRVPTREMSSWVYKDENGACSSELWRLVRTEQYKVSEETTSQSFEAIICVDIRCQKTISGNWES
jgi:hypothetical protein